MSTRNTNQPREPKGVPTGGQWRATGRPEGRADLSGDAGAQSPKCAVKVWRGDAWHPFSEPCGRTAKAELDDGTPVCGAHLQAELKRRARSAAREAGGLRVAAVSKALGCWVSEAEIWRHPDDPDPVVGVRLSDLERIAQRLTPGAAE